MEESIRSLGRTDRIEAYSLLRKFEGRGYDTKNIIRTFFRDWSREDPHAVVEWIVSNKEIVGVERRTVWKVILQNLVQIDSKIAMEVVLEHQSDESLDGIETTLIERLVYSDIEAAISLLSGLSQESKPASLSRIGGALVYRDNPTRALKLSNQLAEHKRSDYYSMILHQWAVHNPRTLLDSISSLSSNELKTVAARALTQTHAETAVLSHNELNYVKKYIEVK